MAKRVSANGKKPKTATRGKGGRPTRYRTEYVEDVFELCLAGLTEEEIAEVFEVSVVTLRNWKKRYPQFLSAVRRGKSIADGKVAKSLYNRAIGMEVPENHVHLHGGKATVTCTRKYLPPDVSAARFWLKNRRSSSWSENTTVLGSEEAGFTLVVHECLRPKDD